jgi:catechol 2,3-dioxygenase-like lactoylglutathione lyase family enzyme
MKLLAVVLTLAMFAPRADSQSPAVERPKIPRPKILGIDHVSFFTTAPDGVKRLYGELLGLTSASLIEPGGLQRYVIGQQWVGYSSVPDPKANDRMDHVAFRTDDIVVLRQYMIAMGTKAPEIEERPDGSRSFMMADPEGHHIEFVERRLPDAAAMSSSPSSSPISRHMIHVGFLVRNREAEDRFYRDILGFHLYWHGSMKPGETDWVAMQVPDGTDWLEYMLNQPETMDLQRMGVMNHISLGVADMKKAQAAMESRGWKPHGNEEAKIGRDGKWQLNVYDPDLSRVELMEFKPVQKSCCSDFTGPHPSE